MEQSVPSANRTRASQQEYRVSSSLYEEVHGGEVRGIRVLSFVPAGGGWKWAALHDFVELADLSDEELEELLAQAR